MKCDSVKLLSSLPFPYQRSVYIYPPNILDEYVKRFRKQLCQNNVMEFLLSKDNNHLLHNRMKYILKIYELEDDYKFNFDISPEQIEQIKKYFRVPNSGLKDLVTQLTGREDIFSEENGTYSDPFNSRNYKIFKALYIE